MEVPEEPVMTPAISVPQQDILTALTPCQELQEPPLPLAALEPEQAPAPAMEVPEGPLMPLAMSEPAQDIHRALTPCQQLQEPPAPLAALESKQATAPVIGAAHGRCQSPLSVEQPASAPEQQSRLAESPKDGFPSLSFQCF